jgi:hypothetical protein
LASFANASPGTNLAVTVNGLTLSGSAGGNYLIPPLGLTANIAHVNPQSPIISTAPIASTITYGQTLTASSLTGGSATNGTGMPLNGAFAFTAPGIAPNAGVTNVPVIFTPTDTVYYTTATTNVYVTVNAATLTITADNQTKTAGLPNPALTTTYSGFVNGDSTNALETLAVVTTTADANSPAGQYSITPAGASATNYIFTYVPGTLTVTAQPQIAGTAESADSTEFVFTFPTVAGQNYQVEYSTNLAIWTPLGNPIPGTGSNVSITNQIGADQGYYKLQISRP